jgi:hypothetical protein
MFLLWLLFFASFYTTCIIVADIHEAGHARACIALGGNVGGFKAWLHGVLPFANPPSTNCSIKPFPALVWAAGPVTSIIAWSTSALIVALLLRFAFFKRGPWGSILWACWSLWYLGELFNDARHAYAPPSLWEDSTQFIHVTGIDRNLVGLPLAAIFVISLWVFLWIQYRLLPESLVRSVPWHRSQTQGAGFLLK